MPGSVQPDIFSFLLFGPSSFWNTEMHFLAKLLTTFGSLNVYTRIDSLPF